MQATGRCSMSVRTSDITYEELIQYWHGKHVREYSWSDITYEELIQINAAVFHSIPINFAIPLVGHYL